MREAPPQAPSLRPQDSRLKTFVVSVAPYLPCVDVPAGESCVMLFVTDSTFGRE